MPFRTESRFGILSVSLICFVICTVLDFVDFLFFQRLSILPTVQNEISPTSRECIASKNVSVAGRFTVETPHSLPIRLTKHVFLQKPLHQRPSVRSFYQTSQLYSSGEATKDKKIKCTLIPGDGVGPELVNSVKEVYSAIGVPVEFEELFLSEIYPSMSVPVETVIESIQRNGICLKGILSTPFSSYAGELQTLNMKVRRDLDLYANVVHIKSFPGIKTKHENLDFFVIREQTEGEYSALEHESVPGVIECMKIITEEKSRRIAKFAFDYATKHEVAEQA
ncbi:Isocitrate dehydrogenase [NAD] subunit beta, mitochondrial [Tyrophagus putrescentiae]|nr:Isocitrate dehydrogenase [NAD] subunit beta, mitochondrial [Tyrophagus putrescentiae]